MLCCFFFLAEIFFTTLLPSFLPFCLFHVFSVPYLLISSVLCSFCCFFSLLCLLCSPPAPPLHLPPVVPHPFPGFSFPLLSPPFPGWTVNRAHAHSESTFLHTSSSSPPFSCSFWHPFDLLLLLWSPTSVPQPRRCPPLCPPRPGPCPSVQPICPTQLASPRGDRRSCSNLRCLLLPGWNR